MAIDEIAFQKLISDNLKNGLNDFSIGVWRKVIEAYEAEKLPNKHSETLLHWDGKDTFVTDKAIYSTQHSDDHSQGSKPGIFGERPTQNWNDSKISDPEYKEAQKAENARLTKIIDDLPTKTP